MNIVVGALRHSGAPGLDALSDRLVSGEATAAWVDGWSGWDAGGRGVVASAPADGRHRFDGVVWPVEAAAEADCLLISATDGTTAVLDGDHPGVSVERLESLDRFRTHGRVTLTGVEVDDRAVIAAPGSGLAEWLSDLAVLIQLAEVVGALEWALEVTLQWTFDRYSFGRPLAADQAIQHRAADLRMWLEASRAITADAAAAAFDDHAPDRSELISAAKTCVARRAPEAMHECVQFHGGIGVTAEHDLHLYLRRVATAAAIHGTARDHAQRLGRIVETRELAR